MNTEIMKTKFSYLLKRMYMRVYAISHPIQDKTILFSSFNGLQYSDNPRAISEKMHEMYPDYHIRWIIDRERDQYHLIPDYVDCIPSEGKKKFQAIATAHCYVYNMNLRNTLIKRKGQFFVQTWHGDRNFKKILYEVWENGQKRPYPVMDNKFTDVAVAGSTYCEEKYHSAFHYYGKIAMTGSPKVDNMLANDPDIQHQIKKRLNLDIKTRVLLYAPTFREGNSADFKIPLDLGRVLKTLCNKTGDNWVCLVRAHPGVSGFNVSNADGMRDVTDYPDMADLLTVTDFLITDYSNTILDFYLTGKPAVCYIADKEEYVRNSRSLKNDPESIGAVCVRTEQELENVIMTHTEEDYARAYRNIDKYYGTKEKGDAAEKVAGIIDKALRHV